LGCYKKTLWVPQEWQNKKIGLEFEGVYMNATVHINKQLVARHPYGYTGFFCDLTPYLKYGSDNQISVNVNNVLQNTRWYSGSGVYRHVWLEVCEPIHIAPWGVYVTSPEVARETSTIIVQTSIENSSSISTKVKIRNTLLTDDGAQVAAVEQEMELAAGSTAEVAQSLKVSPAKLWSIDQPYLYSLKSEIKKDNQVIDCKLTKTGIRSLEFDVKHGFRLNGVTVKLKGGCVHHDCGLLGVAAYDRAEERKVELHKANGFNAIRCAHNPPSPAFLDACDRLGILVIDEAFDSWRESKNPNDYSQFFEEWWERDLTAMVRRDRNHPCVIIWSTGNEILERDGHSLGNEYSRKLADLIRGLDNTRAITNALCPISQVNDKAVLGEEDIWGKMTEKFVEPLDVVGYNYLRHRYESDGDRYPGRIICGTETYPKEAFEYWSEVERLPHVIGDFVWTSMDYLGEAGIGRLWYGERRGWLGDYPWHQAYCGDIDICGFKRPQSYYRDCVWGLSKAPYIAVYKPENYGKTLEMMAWSWPDVVASWDWPGYEGDPIQIDVYCANSEVELFLNGRSLGRKPAGKLQQYRTSFETVYEAGELVAAGYENGAETSRTVLKTAGKPAAIRLTPDRRSLHATINDLSYITVEVVDAAGNVVHTAVNEIYFSVSGAGSLVAVGNGNPVTEEMYVGNHRKVHEGRAMVVVRGSGEPG
ncbi:MAG TPA: glycoside hydrolase family 2 TIM barrel-domain containing protein, partial [Bacillota bacterium]|nr:glycoside hydrolase family 2 TIM barrel-domain containing protein [Bacillota bacterium]